MQCDSLMVCMQTLFKMFRLAIDLTDIVEMFLKDRETKLSAVILVPA